MMGATATNMRVVVMNMKTMGTTLRQIPPTATATGMERP